jgi:hypothetical protein
VFEEASVRFEAEDSALHGILSNTLSQLPEFLPRDLRQSWKALHKHLQVSPKKKNPSEFDRATEETMQSCLEVQSSFLDMSHSTTDGHLPNNTL